MRHPGGPEIQAYIDGEAAAADVAVLAVHLDACPRCAALASEFRARAGALSLAVLEVDGAEPAHWRARDARPVGLRATRRLTISRAVRRAAVVLLAVTGAAAASILGRDLIAGRNAVPDAGDVPVEPAGAPAVAGVLMTPVADSVTIVVEGAGPGARVRLRVREKADVSVNVEGGAVTPRFRVDAPVGRILVDMGGGGGLVVVAVPASLRSAVVRAGGRIVVRFADGRIDPAAAESGVPLGS